MQDLTPKTLASSPAEVPKLANGLTPLLRKHLDSQALAKHRAALVYQLEILAKKFDRFGWDRDEGSAAQDGLIRDWMDALQDYPLDEVHAACRKAVLRNPNKMPNEGHVLSEILRARAEFVAAHPKQPAPEPDRQPVNKETANAILAVAGYAPKRFGVTS